MAIQITDELGFCPILVSNPFLVVDSSLNKKAPIFWMPSAFEYIFLIIPAIVLIYLSHEKGALPDRRLTPLIDEESDQISSVNDLMIKVEGYIPPGFKTYRQFYSLTFFQISSTSMFMPLINIKSFSILNLNEFFSPK